MQPSKIDPHLSSAADKPMIWTQKINYWLGRLFSLFFPALSDLTNRIMEVVTQTIFNSNAKPENTGAKSKTKTTPAVPKKFKNETEKEPIEEEEEPDYNFNLLFGESPAKNSTPPAVTAAPAEISSATEEDAKPAHQEEEKKEVQAKAKEEPTTRSQRVNKWRRRNAQATHQTSPPPTPVPAPAPKPASPPEKASAVKVSAKSQKPIIYENKGGGECQLLAILQGLKKQYPELLKYEEGSKSLQLTAHKLRQIGVDFAKDQVDTYGPYVEDILAYLDSDRKEHNRAEVDGVEQEMKRERDKLEKTFKAKKISDAEYEKQQKRHQDKYAKEISRLEDHVVIDSDENFLTALSMPGFYCSTLHLFALSIHLQLPIYVHEHKGVKNYDLQMFNPLESPLAPIHLLRVGNIHYKYMFYPN